MLLCYNTLALYILYFMEIDTLKCKKIELVDKNGKPRIIMYADDDQGVILFMGEDCPTIQISTSNRPLNNTPFLIK
jgi:hypothetical protein